MTHDLDTRRKKLRIRAARRGFKEHDIIMGRFAEARLEGMGEAELDEFEALLDAPDQDVYGWIIGRTAPPASHDGPVLKSLMAFDVAAILQAGGEGSSA